MPSQTPLRSLPGSRARAALGLFAALGLSACDDEKFAAVEGGGAVSGEGCDAVAEVIAGNCVGCHSAGGGAGGLDLETDWYAAVTDGGLVVAGDSAGSVLYQRITSTTSPMPPVGLMGEANQAIVGDWIDAGAEACAAGTDGADGADGADGGGGTDGAALFTSGCAGCHGADGDSGYAPNLSDEVPGKDLADLKEVIMFGEGTMPAIFPDDAQATAVAQYLLDTFAR